MVEVLPDFLQVNRIIMSGSFFEKQCCPPMAGLCTLTVLRYSTVVLHQEYLSVSSDPMLVDVQ